MPTHLAILVRHVSKLTRKVSCRGIGLSRRHSAASSCRGLLAQLDLLLQRGAEVQTGQLCGSSRRREAGCRCSTCRRRLCPSCSGC